MEIRFEKYLQSVCASQGGFDGVLDDDQEDAFDAWLETKDVNDIVDIGNRFSSELKAGTLEDCAEELETMVAEGADPKDVAKGWRTRADALSVLRIS